MNIQLSEPILVVDQITKSYGNLVANEHVSFDVHKGQVHCLLGENGAGKSTISKCIYGASKPDSGSIIYQADIRELAPDTIITSPLFFWDPSVRKMIELWYDHQVNGTAYDAPKDKPPSFLMKEGGSGLAPFYGFEQKLPKEVLDKVNSVKQDILDGKLVVPLKLGELKGD